jgi:hypothetical protein
MPSLLTSIQHNPEIPSQSNEARRINKKKQIGKEIAEVSLLQMTWSYTSKTQKNSTTKLLDVIKSFSNVAGYKINLQKSVAILHMNNEPIKKKYRQTIPFTTASKKKKSNT